MMGQQTGGETPLFYAFNLDEYVPEHHLLRRIDRFLDLSGLRQHLADFYSHTGRPSVDPELMIRMLIVGYCFGIRSERRLCDEVHLNLGYRWFCRLGLEGDVPDHSTFSKNRHGRFRESDVLRFVFDGVVRRCMREGLVKGEGFAIDASVIPANANWREGVAPDEIDWSDPKYSSRAVREYLAALDALKRNAIRKQAVLHHFQGELEMAAYCARDTGSAPFALRNDKLVHVYDVSRGLACGCICIACGAPLVAKKGEIRVHHFAHADGSNCPTAYETAIHRAAKELLQAKREIVLPAVRFFLKAPRKSPVSRRYALDSVLVEQRLKNIVADCWWRSRVAS